jgi:hypothetical protein
MSEVTPRAKPLLRCDQWPCMFVLPEPVDALLSAAAAAARRQTGRDFYRNHVIGALVTCMAPDTAEELLSLFRSYVASTRFDASPLTLPKKHVTVVLPAPVSHRIDLLVELAGKGNGERMLRRGLVGALAYFHLPADIDDTLALLEDYLALTAKDARVKPWPVSRVLDLRTPRPGRRPTPSEDDH